MLSKRFSRLLKILTGTNAGGEGELLHLEGRLERFVHFWVLVVTHFVRNRCLIRASALAYTSLLALIPLLAVVISIGSSLLKNEGEDKIYQAIASIAPDAPIAINNLGAHTNSVVVGTTNFITNGTNAATATNETTAATTPPETPASAQKQIASQLHSFVQNTRGGALGVTGSIIFVFIAIGMLSRVEETFNDIWGVAHGRNWFRRIVLYWTTITLGSVLVLTAFGLTSSGHFQAAKNYFLAMPWLGNFIFSLLPLFVLWCAFSLIYFSMPNTKVNFSAALFGGMAAGTLWYLNNTFGFLYVSRVVTNSKIYGSIGLVPVFMISLYFSWAILLLGAQIAYAFQNRAAYLADKLADNINQRGREFIALRLMTALGQRFQNGWPPADVAQISIELGVPSRLAQQIFQTLACAQLVTEVGGAETAYVPARALETINAHDILLALRTATGRELPMENAPALTEIYGEFTRIEAAERAAAEKISLLVLVHRSPLPALNPPKPIGHKG